MSNTFEPKFVPSDVVARWPNLALSLWKRSFWHLAPPLLGAALLFKLFPVWGIALAFLIAPSLFIVSFATVQMADERGTGFTWRRLLDSTWPGAVRMGRITLQFAAVFGSVCAALAGIAATLPLPSEVTPAGVDGVPGATRTVTAMMQTPDNLVTEFLYFCATWAQGVMTTVVLGMFIVAIYQGVFGAVLHAQQGMGTRQSRRYGWKAWQVNSASIEEALKQASARFWRKLGLIAVLVVCAFQNVYLSPVGLLLATYIPCLAYVAYRSIFLGKHENVPASARVVIERSATLVPRFAR